MFSRILASATLALLVGCQTTSSPDAAKPTWDRGYMYLLNVAGNEFCGYYVDHRYTQVCMRNLSDAARDSGKKFPVVVFLHGCLKFDGDYGRWLAKLGNIVFSPDSFQRTGRTSQCSRGASKGHILSMRQSEITYAREQLEKLDWVDQSRVFLVGTSEGGRAVADHSGAGYKAKIILSYDCGRGPVKGSLPVLNLVGKLDLEWGNGLCVVSGPNSFAFNVPDRGHTFLGDQFASEKIKMFLGQFN